MKLSNEDKAALVAFMKTLTDEDFIGAEPAKVANSERPD
jgi:hypothetical protein